MAEGQAGEADVVVIGAGPAGLAAATELRRLGVRSVVVLEREADAGGIPRHCGHPPFGMREFARILRGPDYARRLVARALAAGVEIRTNVTVTALRAGGELDLATPAGPGRLAGRAVLLATGVRETSRAMRLIGGEKPGGVLSTGALQGLVHLNRQRPFRRPVILGSELVAFSALLTCRHAGIKPVAMVEPGPRPTAWAASPLLPLLLGVPFATDTQVQAVLGRERVEAIVLAGPGGERRVEADGLIVSGAFRPEATLLHDGVMERDAATGGPALDSFGRLSDPAFFAAGNVLHPVDTAGWCWAEGRQTAHAMLAGLQGRLPDPAEAVPLAVESAAIRLAVPRRIAVGGPWPEAAREIQVRLARPVRGTLRLTHDGTTIASRRIDGLPERRILLRLPQLTGRAGALQLHLDEAA
ncbi:NAD(P)/FAD-dependent oxidoreductase [Zavarzinia sp. CC-PAN008]|uniref:NAD(P)/FAD-dependent oxidoreductase n=1 Tax=Zavarzinia sp. CC-PAN008 TaxID=3243332 RepID=UPI003F7499F5